MTTETATKRSLITFFDSGSRWQKAGLLREYIAVTAPLGPAGVAIACVHRDAATQRWFSQVQVDGRMWPPEVRLSVEQAHGWNGGAGFWWRNFAALPEATHAAERLIQDLIDAHAAAAAAEVRELDCTPSEYEMTGRAEMDAFLAEQ